MLAPWFPGESRGITLAHMRILRFLVAAALGVGLAVTVLGPAGPAQAAYPACNDHTVEVWGVYERPGGTAGYKTNIPSASGNIDCTLRSGAHNWSVVMLQIALNDCFNAGLAVDGQYGPRTRDVVTWFQAVKGITVDGVYGPQTRTLMLWGFRFPGTPINERPFTCRYHWNP